MMSTVRLWLLLFSLVFLSCSDDTLPPQNDRVGFNYFPLQGGLFRIYDVQDITFNLNGSDTAVFQLREVVTDSFQNVDNDFTYVINRFTRINDTMEWDLDSVWTARRTFNTAVSIENNVPIIKLVFPINEEVEWDGNGLSARMDEFFNYENLFESLSIGEMVFDSTITVVQSDLADNLIMADQRREIYARNIGLIQKDFMVLNFCSREDCLGEGIIEGGRIQKLDLIDFGFE